jgi:hypothetical protein
LRFVIAVGIDAALYRRHVEKALLHPLELPHLHHGGLIAETASHSAGQTYSTGASGARGAADSARCSAASLSES